jgi:hypothetical protein
MRDQGCIIGRLGSGQSQLGGNVRCSGRLRDVLAVLGNQRRLQRVDVIGQLRRIKRHRRQKIICFAAIAISIDHQSNNNSGDESRVPHSARELRSPSLLRRAPVDPLK